jgi:uncharacterized protein YndB with AHSA1/START domain
MNETKNPDLDLAVSRIIKAPRRIVWDLWTDPASFASWWVPAPARCRVVEMDLRPGGALVTTFSEDGGEFQPHVNACFLAVEPQEKIVFTDALVAGWRPSEAPFMTAVITMKDHPEGTEYHALAMHSSRAIRDSHEEMGFYDGWGAVSAQLAELAEKLVQEASS